MLTLFTDYDETREIILVEASLRMRWQCSDHSLQKPGDVDLRKDSCETCHLRR